MKTLRRNETKYWSCSNSYGIPPGRFIADAEQCIGIADFLGKSSIYGRGDELEGRSVLLATKNQMTTASALVELDGVARRIVLWPPDLTLEHLSFVIDAADVDAIVSDQAISHFDPRRPTYLCSCTRNLMPKISKENAIHDTDWILLTSGTTGRPKLVLHNFDTLTSAIQPCLDNDRSIVWCTFYDIRRYGGVQVLLRAALTGASLVLSASQESPTDFLARAASAGVTHISGTPSHWRRALMSPSIQLLKPEYIRLSGEAVDQAIINNLRAAFPAAHIVHAFASTEAGVALEVADEMTGFPASALRDNPQVEMRVVDGTLRVRSAGNALRYLGDSEPSLKDGSGFVDTRDAVDLRDARYYFSGRRDGVINVGGRKVYPEEVEAVINRHPQVHMCLVRAKLSPITGALVIADVVLRNETLAHSTPDVARHGILLLCREALPAYKVPATINVVTALPIAASGKVMRQNA